MIILKTNDFIISKRKDGWKIRRLGFWTTEVPLREISPETASRYLRRYRHKVEVTDLVKVSAGQKTRYTFILNRHTNVFALCQQTAKKNDETQA